jgi:hypothetical protein
MMEAMGIAIGHGTIVVPHCGHMNSGSLRGRSGKVIFSIK